MTKNSQPRHPKFSYYFSNSRKNYYRFLGRAVKTNSRGWLRVCTNHVHVFAIFYPWCIARLPVPDVAAAHKAKPGWINTRCESSKVPLNFEKERGGKKAGRARSESRVARRRYVSFGCTTAHSASLTYRLSVQSLILPAGAKNFSLTFSWRASYPPAPRQRKLTGTRSRNYRKLYFSENWNVTVANKRSLPLRTRSDVTK